MNFTRNRPASASGNRQKFKDFGNAIFLVEFIGQEGQFRLQRGLLWRGNTGKILDMPGPGFGVKPLGIPPLADFNRRIYVRFHKTI